MGLLDFDGFTRTRTRRVGPPEERVFKLPETSPYTHIEVPEEIKEKFKKKQKIDKSWQLVEAITILLEAGVLTEIEADMILQRVEEI